MYEWARDIIVGLISGIVAGGAVSAYFWYIGQIRLVSIYARETANNAFELNMQVKECIAGKEPRRLKELLKKPLQRNFVIKIPRELQKAIADCNKTVYSIGQALDEKSRHDLTVACGRMSGKCLDLQNAATVFETKHARQQLNIIKLFGVTFVLLCSVAVAMIIIS